MADYGTPRPKRRRGRGLLITLIILLIIIGGVLFAADRVGRSYAQRIISDKVSEQVANQKATSQKPDVTIEGFPFLTQVLHGRYDEIKIELADFSGPADQNGTKKIRLPLLDIRAKDVQASLHTLQSGGNIVAGTVTGIGEIDYPQLVELIGQPGVKLAAKDGKLTGSAPVQVLGQTVNVTGTAELTVKSGNVVQVRFSNVSAAGLPDNPLVKGLINSYVNKLAFDLKVPALPLKLTVQNVEAQADGLKVTAGAADVALNSSGL